MLTNEQLAEIEAQLNESNDHITRHFHNCQALLADNRELQAENAALRDALACLEAIQNGLPLPKYRAEWEAAMAKADALLRPKEKP